ncbi:H-NS family histone-like protein [Photobacterium toruni]|uniref:H-NS family histone-like protein n=1 Tax=Photobacterium toruni TaxID=1935446 RepID=UPI00210F923D|nr:H-NS family nucleoid-associated regulatory protein [Photobacterium toruni]
MTDAIKLLMNPRTTAIESISLDQLQNALNNLTQIVNERIAKDEQEKSAAKEREEKLEIYRQMLLSDGLSIEDFVSIQNKASKKPRTIRPPKYKYINAKGDEKTWTGQGRIPTVLKTAIDNGINLDEFLI